MLNKRAINLKRRLAAGETTCGTWVSLPSPTACEVTANVGFDWILVDSEHSLINPETLQHMLMAFKGSDTVPLIRVPWNDHVIIKQVLDMGWDGVIIPQVNTVDEVRQAVSACRYPPDGIRGYGPRRAGNYYVDEEEYVALANESIICTIQVESVAAADHIDEMLKVPGVDSVYVGRNDMAGSIGRTGEGQCDEVWNAVRKIFAAAKAAGIPCGNAGLGLDRIDETLEMGCQLIGIGEDTGFLQKGMVDAVKAYRKIIDQKE